jgi:hypothetical protein
VAELGKSRGEARRMRERRGQKCGHAEGERTGAGGGWSLGAVGLSPPPLARRRTGAGCPPPGPRPRTGPHGEPAATNARTGGHANGQRPRAPGRRQQAARLDPEKFKTRHLRGSGRRPLPERHRESLTSPGTRQERLRRPPDRLRRHLTEPVRRVGHSGRVMFDFWGRSVTREAQY